MTPAQSAALDAASDPSWTDVVGALGAAGTLVVAVWALVYAHGQLKEARTLRREQAQPYVVVSADTAKVSQHLVDISVANLGTTGARDLSITSTPPLVRTGDSYTDVVLPDGAPFLAPGQVWRTFWDSTIEREGSGLPDRFEITVSYTDSFGERHSTTSVLDWNVFRGRMFATEYGVHDVVKTLREVKKTLDKLARPDRMVQVATYDGKTRDAEIEQQRQEHRQLMERLTREENGGAPS
ncbi:hypothetical protein [Kineococcus arenarius]|uniref:hypothetical protein n=1 Tax=Kineococcus sp. SYSU DK007 TaxID=3383128 RepID=UPI003D7C7BF6